MSKLKNLALFYCTNFTRGYTFNKIKKTADFSLSLDSIHRFSLENAVFRHLKNLGKEIYYFSEKKEVDFVCKDKLKIKEIINVCYDLENKETLLREVSALIEGMKYFKLNKSKIIVFEGDNKTITEQGFKIEIIPFYLWVLDK